MQHAVFDAFGDGLEYDRFDYYAILGCNRYSTKSEIIAKYRRRIRQLHPDKSLKQVPEIFYELQNAKNILTDDETKQAYDAWFDCSIDIPWSLWLRNFRSLSGIHWRHRVHSASMLQYRNEEKKMENSCVDGVSRQLPSHHSSLLKKFRDYEI
ncbi:unnamed protein product [Onchocerca flexuosa]|uniref:J domain-containing protein n=1 Tax=Onchocerca flexuosa TaxID=387005 RepID=A0A183H170_9BILA|nr:unnamed protein product [Onchocerca flexuosa]